jgi:EmrB/QacA subfamily drug resistance transporter
MTTRPLTPPAAAEAAAVTKPAAAEAAAVAVPAAAVTPPPVAGGGAAATPRRVLALASAATFVAFLDATVVNVAFPALQRDFPGASLALLSWVVAAYGVVFAAVLTPAGRLADALGRKAVFLSGFGVFVLASAACAVAPSVGVLIAVRAVQGVGAALMIPAGLGMVLAVTAPERRAAAVGAWGAASSFAALAGPILGSVLIDAASWRLVFAINVPIGIAVVAIGHRTLPALPPTERGLPDLPGTAVLAAGAALVVAGLTQSGPWGWGDARTLGALAAGLALLGAAVLRARTAERPALDVTLWRSRDFATANLASLIFGAALFSWLLACVLYVTSVWHYSILETGLAITPGAVTSMGGAVVAGRVIDRVGARALVAVSGLVLAAVGMWLALGLTAEPDFLGIWLPTGLISGATFGTASVALTTAAARALPPVRFAAGVGLNMTGRQLGGAAGVAVLASILEAAAPGPDGFKTVFAFCAAAGLATGLAALRLAAGSRS